VALGDLNLGSTTDTRPPAGAAVVVRAFDTDLSTSLGDDLILWGDAAATRGQTLAHRPEYARFHLERPDVPHSVPGYWINVDGSCQAVLLPKRLPVGRTIDRMAGGMTGYWLAGNSLIGGDQREAIETVVSTCEALCRTEQVAGLLIEDVDEAGPFDVACRELARNGWRLFTPTGWQPRWRIDMPATEEAYWSKFNSKRRGNLRRQQRKLGGEVRRFTAENDVDDFLELAHVVSRKTWQTQAIGLRVGASEFERSMYRLAARGNNLRCYVLMKDGQPISFAIGLQSPMRYSLEEIGYDPAFAEWSPGMTLLCHVLDDLFAERTPPVFDFGGGDAAYKQTLANRAGRSATLWLIAPGVRRYVAMRTFEFIRKAKSWTRKAVGDVGLKGQLRRLTRRGAIPVVALANPIPAAVSDPGSCPTPEADAPLGSKTPTAPRDLREDRLPGETL
jgi:hypothetical protein